jgi:hypothetical protein
LIQNKGYYLNEIIIIYSLDFSVSMPMIFESCHGIKYCKTKKSIDRQ